jgi:hypothetical protein
LVFIREYSDNTVEINPSPASGELAKAFKTYKNEIEQKKKTMSQV